MLRSETAIKTMNRDFATGNFAESKDESRSILDKYYSVQSTLSRVDPAYLFKLRDISGNGLCILVKQDSSAFKQLNVGDILNMEYNPTESSGPPKLLKTKITSKNSYGRFTEHFIVELSIIEEQDGCL
jgi:hypothetical protein